MTKILKTTEQLAPSKVRVPKPLKNIIITPRPYPLVIKYMGSKAKMINYLAGSLNDIGVKNLPLVDLFAGACSISGAFGSEFSIISNDIQAYSEVIASTYLNPIKNLNVEKTLKIAQKNASLLLKEFPSTLFYSNNMSLTAFNKVDKSCRKLIQKDFQTTHHLFTKMYSGTWWSAEQCVWIDSLRYALDTQLKQKKITKADFDMGLTCLMHAMAYCSQGTGHYAQYRDANTESSKLDILKYRTKSLPELFVKKAQSLIDWNIKNTKDLNHKLVCMDYKDCLNDIPKSIVYADPPYAFVHYSRFYHAIETVTKYDYPKLQEKNGVLVKGRYREERHQSPFCIKTKVPQAFKDLFSGIKSSGSHMILSYSNTGMITLEGLLSLAKKEFGIEYALSHRTVEYKHMTMGRKADRSREVQEAIIIAKRKK